MVAIFAATSWHNRFYLLRELVGLFESGLALQALDLGKSNILYGLRLERCEMCSNEMQADAAPSRAAHAGPALPSVASFACLFYWMGLGDGPRY